MSKSAPATLEIACIVRSAWVVLVFDRESLASLPAAAQVPDVGARVHGKRGRGVMLSAIAAQAPLDAAAQHVHIASLDPKFTVSVPISEILASAIVVYELDGAPLPAAQGGPFRLLACGHPDECVSVKALALLTFADSPGPDTRPKDDEAHRELHRRAAERGQK